MAQQPEYHGSSFHATLYVYASLTWPIATSFESAVLLKSSLTAVLTQSMGESVLILLFIYSSIIGNGLVWAQRLINLEIPVLVRSLKSSNVELS